MPERLLQGRPKASAAFEPEPLEGGEHLSPPPGRGPGGGVVSIGSVLAFDFGQKRIGVAIGTHLGAGSLTSARALTTIASENNDARFAAIAELIAEWQPVHLLVGRPLNDDGTPHDMTARCERFANQLRGRFRLPVDAVDERFSSVEADASLRQRGLSWQQRKAQVDAEAALIILQSWSDTHAHGYSTASATA